MGLKKIAELRRDLNAKADALAKFKAAADLFVETHAKIKQAYDNVVKLRVENLAKVERLDTLGIKEFEAYKTSLVAVYSGWNDRPLPTKPLEAVVDSQRKAVDAAVNERIAKLAASFPKEVKAGMVFRFTPTGRLIEIVGQPKESKNPNLKGDDKTFWDTTEVGGSAGTPVSLGDLKKSYKYINV